MKAKLLALFTMGCSLAFTASLKAQTMTTFAGTGTAGWTGDGGAATAAQLNIPAGLAQDAAGNLYIADYQNDVVRKIDAATGIISTIAGSGTPGFSGDGSAATAAKMNVPTAIAVNQSTGDIYIADRSNNRIRKITASTGVISTIAGTGTYAHTGDGGAATSAALSNPTDIKLDNTNSKLYIGSFDNTVRMVDLSTGIITNIAGTSGSSGSSGDGGAASSALLSTPYLAFDNSNNLYIADVTANVIRKIDAATGIITKIAGTGTFAHTGDGGAASAAAIKGPVGIIFDGAGNMYFSENTGYTIRRIDGSTGVITTVAGTGLPGYSGDGGAATSADLSYPWGTALLNGKFVFSDSYNNRLRAFDVCRTVIFVDSSATVSGSGYSWSSPFKTLSQALDTANTMSCPVQIWVKKGTYYPMAGTAIAGSRDSSFRIYRNNIKVYGGFAGTETSLSARSASANPTILSGDIGVAGDSTDNSYHVLTLIATASSPIDTNTVIDGFTISNGTGNTGGSFTYGSSTFNRQDGAGILLYGAGSGNSCSPQIANCTIAHNTAGYGGGIYADCSASGNSATVLRSNLFSYNTAVNSGGGVFVNAQASGNNTMSLEHCTFSDNNANNGAGIYFHGSGGTIASSVSNTTFQNNNATAAGGAAFHTGNSALTYSNNTFSNNTAANGAGVYSGSSATISYTGSRFSGNIATAGGGALQITSGTSSFSLCVFNNNKASDATSGAGGAMEIDGGTATLNNCVLSGNRASGTSGEGGGAINVTGGTLNLQSTTLAGNYSSSTTSADANTLNTQSGSTVNVLNTIIWGAAATQVNAGGTVNYTNSLVKGATLSAPSISTDPKFTNESTPAGTDGIWLTADDGLNLLPCSPAINAASSAAPSTDILNRSRLGLPDMGAYEEQGAAMTPAPTVSTPVYYCQGSTATALTAVSASASDTLKWYDASLTLLPGAPTPATGTADTTTYYVSQTAANSCEGPKTAIQVIINPTPATPAATTSVVYCQNATATALTATLSAGSDTLKWYDASATALSGAPTPSTATAGTYTWYVSQKTSAGCEGPKTSITVTVNPTPAAPSAVTPVIYCEGATATALSATLSSDTLNWYDATAALLSGAPTPSTATAGTYTWYVSQKNTFGCESPKNTINVTVNPTPLAPTATTSVVYCQNATATPLTATLSAGSDTLKWYDASSTALSGAPTPSTATAGTYTWYVSQKTSAGCEGPKTSITVTVNPTPAAPSAVTPVIYCQGATATALSATLTSDTLNWYDATAALLSGAPTPSTATAGTYTWYVSQKNTLGCESVKKIVTVTVNPTPTAPVAVTSPVYCQGSTATALTATLSAGSDTLKWYDASSTALSGAPTPSTATAGTYTWYVSQKTSAGCEGPKTTITVTVNPTPLAPVTTSPVNYCLGATTTALTATLTSDTIKWYDATSTLLSGAPVPSAATAGTYTWYVSQKNTLGCESPKATITVNINTIPVAPTATSPIVYCQNATATALTATKTAAVDTLKWYDATSAPLSAAPTPSTATTGTYTWYVSEKSNFGCEGAKTAITVTINPTPVAPTATTPVTYCQGATASVLTATLSGATDTMRWYNSSSTLLSGAPTPSTGTAGTFTWSVSEKNSFGCESPKKTITVTVNPTPVAPTAVTPVIYCQDDVAVALSGTKASATDTLKWYNSSSSLLGATAPTPSTTTPGTYTWYVSDKTALGCEGPKTTITVTVNPKPSAPTVVTPIDLCVGIPAIALSATGTNLKWYLTALGGASSSTLIPPTTTPGSYTYYVSQTNSLGCEGPRTGLTVNVRPSPVVTITPRDMPALVFCISDSVILQASSATAISYQWLKSGTFLPGSTRDTFTASVTDNYSVIVKDIYGCADTEMVYVMENPLPKPSLSPTDILFCPGTTVMLYANPNTSGYRYDWYKDNILMGIDTSFSAIPVGIAGIYHLVIKDVYTCVTRTNDAYVSSYPAVVKPEIVQTGTSLKTKIAYASYQWYRNGKPIAGATSRTFNMSFDGTYYVVVQDANGCQSTSDPIESNVLKVDEQSVSSIHLYPNPTTSRVQIDASGKVDVLVTDLSGRQVLQLKQVTEVDLGNFADGLYMFRISDSDGKLLLIEKVNKISGQ